MFFKEKTGVFFVRNERRRWTHCDDKMQNFLMLQQVIDAVTIGLDDGKEKSIVSCGVSLRRYGNSPCIEP